MIKQIVVMRTDLNMRKGKMIAQGSHASMKVFFDRMWAWDWQDPADCEYCLFEVDCKLQEWQKRPKDQEPNLYPNCNPCKVYDTNVYKTDFRRDMVQWMEGAFTKIVVGIDSLEGLMELKAAADKARLPCALIEDAGKTEFKEDCKLCGGVGAEIDMNASNCGYVCPDCEGTGKINNPTITCIAIGPAKAEDVDKITGNLKLL